MAAFSRRNKYDEPLLDESDYAGRSSLFGNDPHLDEVRKSMKREYAKDDRFQAD